MRVYEFQSFERAADALELYDRLMLINAIALGSPASDKRDHARKTAALNRMQRNLKQLLGEDDERLPDGWSVIRERIREAQQREGDGG
jgi:hypothetical protein